MAITGGCQCGAVRYEAVGEPKHVALCHCTDCRKSAGAPVVSWIAFDEDRVSLTQGQTVEFNSSGNTFRSFCPICGTGLLYRNAQYLPGIVDIQSATLDDPGAFPPQAHIQTADRLGWFEDIGKLPQFERFPG